MDIDQRKRVILEATKGMTEEEKRILVDDLNRYFDIRQRRIERRQSNWFKPINFNDVLGHIKRG